MVGPTLTMTVTSFLISVLVLVPKKVKHIAQGPWGTTWWVIEGHDGSRTRKH